jgi:hypothetical protein
VENKDTDGVSPVGNDGLRQPPPDPLHQPPDLNALSLEPDSQPFISQERPVTGIQRLLHFVRRLDVILVILLLIAGGGILFAVLSRKPIIKQSTSIADRFQSVQIPLNDIIGDKDLSLAGVSNVTINGMMQLNNSLVVTPTLQPTGAKPGQIYYDQATNQLAYYNGQTFVFLNSPPSAAGGVQSLGGATGQLTVGSGLNVANGQLSNSGVLTVQGQRGDVTFTAGPGLVINGTTFSNSGVLSVASGSPNVTVANDGSGGVTSSVATGGVGTGTVTSAGGTAGRIPLFTSAQNIEDSIITQSGLTVTINGDLSVITGGLSLANALTVSNGGSGATSFANNGVLVGQGTGAFAAVAAGGAGLCLMSTGGLPAWGACPGSTGVTSLNGLTGGLSIANASAAGSVITIDNASTAAKGIASFDATNFSVSSGAVNTIQNINTGATPTFAGLNTNSITPSAGLTVGSTSQTLTLQGNATTTVTATNGANTTALSFVSPTANVTYRLQTASAGTYDICTTTGNCSTAGGVTSPGGTTNRLAKFTGAQVIGDSIIVDNGSNVDVGGTLSVQSAATFVGDVAVNGGDITSSGALNITPGGTLTIGVTGQQLTLQGNASTSLTATNGANTTALTFQSPAANVTYRLPTASAGAYDICTTAGNCVGSGGGVTTSGGTANRLAKFTGTQVINDSTISDDGTNVTTSVDLIIQGGDVTVGVASSQTGSIKLAHSGSSFVGTILQGALTADRTYTLPDADGTICLTSGNCSGAGSPNTLQAAYDAGNTITTTTSRDVAIALADSATDSNFTVTTSTGATGYVGILRANGAGTADPAQLLLVDNLDVDRVQPIGLKIQAAGGGMTTAIDLTDAEIVTAINIAANDIVGTTGNIDLSNFDVVGATGSITTAGTVNGQTISSAASFTGTVAVAGNTTLTGDIAVNGGDITSSGALNITPGGTFTVGATGQQLVLQGSASTQLTATGGGFTTTVGFNGTPTGAVTYNFDRAAAGGTYTICTSVGNCATAGGVTSPGGTTGAIAKFTGAQTIGDSLLSESGGIVTVNGNLNLTAGNQYRINGVQISSADLSNDSNLAKLNASQTFTGNTVAFQNGTNSTNAFNVQNVAGHRIMTIDSSSAQLVLGTASTLDGKLVFGNVSNANTVTIVPGTPTGNRTLTLPDASGVICTDSGNCAGAGATLQTAYNFSVGGTTPKIKVNSSLGGVDIQDADTPIGANLLNIRASNGAGLGSVVFGVGNTGTVTLQNSANSTSAFRLLTAGGTSILTGDTTNGQILLGQSSTLNGTIVFRNATNANTITLVSGTATTGRTITLPDADGTICLTSGNCSGAGSPNTLQAAYDAGNTITSSSARDITIAMADTATDSNFLIDLQCDTSCGANGRFAIQDDGTDVFRIAPAGGAALFQPTVDTTSSFNIRTSGSNNMFTVDTQNSQIGIALGASNLPSLTSSGVQIRGAIRLSGADGTYSDTYITTKVGTPSSIPALINIVNYDPGATGQFIAMGIPVGSNTGGRAISLFDARASAHYPTLAVFSPNESVVGGFSWDGSDSTFLTKTTSNDMALQANGLNIITLQNVSSAARLGVGIGSPAYALDVNGDANISTGSAYKINGTDICTASGCTPAAGSGNYIQNTTTVQTNASIAIQSAADANVTALLKQRATQSADLLRVVDSSDGLIFNVDTFGNAQLTGNMTINEYLGVGVANDSGIALNVSSDLSNTQIGLKVSSVTSGQTADVAQFFGPSSRSMTYGANGALTVKAGSSQTASLFEIQSAAGGVFGSLTEGGQLTLGRIAASGAVGAGSLVLADGTTSNFGATLNTTTLTANRTIALPDASGTVCLQGSTNCSFAATTCVLTGTYICNGGNTPVSSVAIGTTNAQPLNFMTNSVTRGSFTSGGLFQVFGNGTGSARIGGDCSSNYTAINLGGTTPFDCTSYNFLSGPTDTSLYINRPSGSSIFVREGNSSTNQLSIAGGGALTAQNTTDTTAGFRVLNAGSVPLFQIDTTNSRVYIGNPTGDTTGALLVLDTKTDASDPTAVDGGMYFNSFYKRLRCYYDGQWRFCNDSVGLTYGYNLEEDFIGGGNDFGTHNWTQAVSGAGSIVSGAGPDSSTRPGQIQLSIGTVASGTNFSSLYLNGNSAETLLLGNTNGTRIEVEFAASIPTLADATNDYNVHVGLCDDIPSASCANGIYFEYDRDQSVNWRFGAANGGSRTLNNSSTAVTSGWHRFKMVYTYSSTGPTAAIEYFVDGVSIGTHTNTNVPTTNTTQPQFDIMRDAGAGTSDRILIADYFQYRSTLTTAR